MNCYFFSIEGKGSKESRVLLKRPFVDWELLANVHAGANRRGLRDSKMVSWVRV